MLVGIGAGLTFMPVTVTVLDDVEPVHAGAASGMVQMSQQVGGSLGLAVLVTVYASHTSPGDVVGGHAADLRHGCRLPGGGLRRRAAGAAPGRPRPDAEVAPELEENVELAA